MAEIRIPMKEFKGLVAEMDCRVFESADAVAMSYGHHLLIADKKGRLHREFDNSIPMLAIGYSGVARWEMDQLPKRGGRGRSKR